MTESLQQKENLDQWPRQVATSHLTLIRKRTRREDNVAKVNVWMCLSTPFEWCVLVSSYWLVVWVKDCEVVVDSEVEKEYLLTSTCVWSIVQVSSFEWSLFQLMIQLSILSLISSNCLLSTRHCVSLVNVHRLVVDINDFLKFWRKKMFVLIPNFSWYSLSARRIWRSDFGWMQMRQWVVAATLWLLCYLDRVERAINFILVNE